MPTIDQLPNASALSPADELPLSQGGVTRQVAISTLLAGTQRAITLATGGVLGRASLGPGPAEALPLGVGLGLAGGALAATGLDHIGFAAQPTLTLTDTVVLNSNGQPRQMPVGQLLGLYAAGANISISPAGVIAATALSGPAGPPGPAGPAGAAGAPGAAGPAASITAAPASVAIASNDRVGISQGGADRAIAFANLLAGADVSASNVRATAGSTAYALGDHLARRLDPRDFASNMFSGAPSQDDSVGIQAAINYAQLRGGGTIYLPSRGVVSAQLATPLVISRSGVSLVGQTRSMLVHDITGPYPECAVKLRWVGAAGATMLRVAPPLNSATGTALGGCDISGLMLDCNGIAAVGVLFASVRHSRVDLMVAEAVADGVLLDTVDIGESNDCQSNEFSLMIRILTTTGNGLRLAGSARVNQLGNTSYNQFRAVSVLHNAGDAIVLDYADSNMFDRVLIQNRPSFTSTLGTAGAGRSIVFKGSSEVVSRSSGPVTMFGANNNVFNQLSCAGPIASLGRESGYTSPASENRILRFDVGNSALNLATETGATIQVSTTDNVDFDLAALQPSFGDRGDMVLRLRDSRGGEALAVSSATGDHVQLYQFATKMWGYGIDGATNDLRFTPSGPGAGQVNLGNGQSVYSLNGLGVGTRVPANTPNGVIYLVDAGNNGVPAPANGMALYVANGALTVKMSGGRTAIVSPPQPATATVLGGVKAGSGLTVAADGTLSVAGATAGPQGPAGPTYSPPRRTVTIAADTPGVADDQGTIAYAGSQPTTVTISDLGALRRYAAIQTGAGAVTFVASAGTTLFNQGRAVPSVTTAYQGAAVTMISTGTGVVYAGGGTL